MAEIIVELLTFGIATALLYFICNLWSKADAEYIHDNWGKSRLGSKFHRQRLIYKGITVFFSATVYALDFEAGILENIVRFMAYSHFAIWFWWYFFDRRINIHMNRDIYYIGQNAKTDTFLAKMKKRLNLTDRQTHLWIKLPGMISALVIIILVAIWFY